MSGVIVAMRRTLLSCTSLARNGLIALGMAALLPAAPAHASDLPFVQAIAAWLDLDHQEFVILATALALLGFSVVAAILLMRTRVRAAAQRGAAALRHRRSAGPGRPPARAVVRRTPDPDRVGRRRQSPADQRRYLAAAGAGFAAAHSGVWNLAAAGAGAADGSCGRRAARGRRGLSDQSHHLERPRAGGDGPRHRRPGHCADSRTRRIAPRTGGDQPALQGAVGRNRDAARLRRRGALADLGQGRQGRSQLRQCRLCAGDRGRQRRGCDRSRPRTARQRRPRRDGPGVEGRHGLQPRGCRSWSAANGASTMCAR